MRLNHCLFPTLVLIGCLGGGAFAEEGDSYGTAPLITVGMSGPVSLLEDSSWFGEGVRYLKIALAKGSSCTIWTSGVNQPVDLLVEDQSMIGGGLDWNFDIPWFDISSDNDALNSRAILRSSSWLEESPDAVLYYIRITGRVGQQVTLHTSASVVQDQSSPPPDPEPEIVYGTEVNPKSITVTTSFGTHAPAFFEGGKFYYTASLTEGKVYKFGLLNATSDSETIEFSGTGIDPSCITPYQAWTDASTGGKGWLVTPKSGGVCRIVVKGTSAGRLTLRYQMVGPRKPQDHGNVTTLVRTGDIATASVTPGYRSEPLSGFDDKVIDEQLFKVNLTKNVRYVFETEGAVADLEMELYKADGTVLASNAGGRVDSKDCVLGYLPTATADYFVGVCQKLADGQEKAAVPPCTLRVRQVTEEPETAETLTPAPGSLSDDVIDEGAASRARMLSASNWVDSFRFSTRKGITYRFRAKEADARYAGKWTLKGTIYSLDSKGARSANPVQTIDDLLKGGNFAADKNANYVIDVEVAGGAGIEFPYALYSLAANPAGGSMGTLKVMIGGATAKDGAAWALVADGSSATWYGDGDSIVLTEDSWAVKFKAVTGWTAPTNTTASVGGYAETVLSVRYSDSHDAPGNDAVKGDGAWDGKKVTTLSPKAVAAGTAAPYESRSLWNDDESDWFKFSAALSTFYTFRFTDSDKLGDAMFEIYAPDHETLLDGPCREVTFISTGTKTETYYVRVFHSTGARADSQYALEYSSRKVSALKPSQHATVPAGTGTFVKPDAAGGSATFTPGYRNARTRQNRDNVIDESLFKVTLVKGETYLFETEGADAALRMELYDGSGKVLAANACGKTNGCDCVIAWTATASTDFFLGVCQDLDDDDRDEATAGPCTFRVTKLAMAPSAAEPLAPVIGQPGDDPVEKGAASRAKLLSPSNWTDTFTLAGRKGVTYRLRAAADDPVCTNLWKLRGVVYQLTAAGKRPSKPTQTIDDLARGGEIPAAANANFEMDVTVADCPGVTYAYTLHSLACADVPLGTLSVEIGGATRAEGAALTLVEDGSSAPKYADGDSVLLQAGPWTAKFVSVKNWTTPTNVTFAIEAGKTNLLSVKYCDTCDVPGEDAVKGDGAWDGKKVTTLSPKALAAGKAAPNVSRSLWADDGEDWFKFTTAVNTYYTFTLVDSDKLGDAVIEVYAPVTGAKLDAGRDLIASGKSVNFLFRGAKSTTYYVCVRHGTDGRDSQYVMEYFSQQVGCIGFAKAAYSVKDSATSVTIPVNRTSGSAGTVRVRYTTVPGTALPGTNYVGQSGILTWGDKVTKSTNVVVKLIPDLIAHWQEDRSFSLRLETIEPTAEEKAEGVTVPRLGIAETVVTLSDSTKKASGTVQFCGWGVANEPFENAKKPAAEVEAGAALVLWLERTGGADGKIGVTVTPTKGKAVAGTDFDGTPETIVWEDGDQAPKPFVLRTIPSTADYSAAKTMTVKLTADKTCADVAKLGTSATVTIVDGRISRTMEDYAKSYGKDDGIKVAAGKTDTWYFDQSGLLRSVTPAKGGSSKITVTLTGPGKFAFTPYFGKEDPEDKSDFTCKISKPSEDVSLEDGVEVVRYLPKGSVTVTFTLTRDRNSTGDVVASFADYDGQPFLWKPLVAPTLVSPLAYETVSAGKDEGVWFHWSAPEDDEVIYLFSLDRTQSKVGKPDCSVLSKPCVGETKYRNNVPFPCCDCGEEGEPVVAGPGEIQPGVKQYWRVDAAFIDAKGDIRLVNTNSSVWTVNPVLCGATTPDTIVASGTDAYGTAIAEIKPDFTQYPVRLVQGVAVDITLGCSGCAEKTLKYALASGSPKLPAGMSIKDGRISGAPTKAGTTVCAFQTSYNDGSKTVKGGTIALRFEVEPIGLAAGTFSGVLLSEDSQVTRLDLPSGKEAASLAVTVTEAGKISSAKAAFAGASYSFTGTSYDACVEYFENGKPGVIAVLSKTVSLKPTGASKATTYTNLLTIAACRGTDDDQEALDTPMRARLELFMLSDDKKSVLTNVTWIGRAVRDNAKVASVIADEQDYVGYYTLALSPQNPMQGLAGCGYLGVTIDAKAKAKVTGVLLDGTTVSLSAPAAYVSADEKGLPAVIIPIYSWLSTPKIALYGWLKIVQSEDGVPFIVSDEPDYQLLQSTGNAAKTYGGNVGYRLGLEPVGGFYNTLYGLQAYYLNDEFKLAPIGIGDIPLELFGGKTPVVYPGFSGGAARDEVFDIAGDAITIAKNPANLTFSFTRKTGLFSGKFDIQVDNGTKVTKLGSYNHKGVLLMTRDANANLTYRDAVMAGFYLTPMTLTTPSSRSWSASLPFLIRPEAREDGWYLE